MRPRSRDDSAAGSIADEPGRVADAVSADAGYGGADATADAVQALVCAQGLGELLAVYWPASRVAVLLGWLLLTLFPLVFLIGSAPVIPLLVTGAVLWPAAARGLVRSPVLSRRAGEKRIYLYEQGLVHVDAKGALDLFCWDQIHTVFRRLRIFLLSTGLARPRVRCLLTRADGRTLVLTSEWSGAEHLAREAGRRVARAQMPAVRAALERGRRVQFGKLVVDAAGVSGPHQSAPWSQITVQDAGARGIRLHATDSLAPLSGTPEWRIPNLQLLLNLIRVYQQEGA